MIPPATHAFVSLARTGEVAVVELDPPRVVDCIAVGQHPDGIAFAGHRGGEFLEVLLGCAR